MSALLANNETASEDARRPPRAAFAYDAFFTYASDPDRHLVREVESFVEGLHRNPLIPEAFRCELEACVDGSDFKRPRTARLRQAHGNVDDDPVFQIIVEHMSRSRHLVVFVGPVSRNHRWIGQELGWWLEHREADTVFLVLSHGETEDSSLWMPDIALKAGLERRLWLDFRGSRRASKGSRTNRIYEEEQLRLAAELIDEDVVVSDLIKGWKALHACSRKAERVKNVVLGLVGAVLIGGLGWAIHVGLDNAEANRVAVWTTLASAGATLDPDRRLDALSYGLAALKTRPSADAFRAIAESLQILASPVAEVQLDSEHHAIDAVAPVANGRWLAAAGFDTRLRLLSSDGLSVVATASLQGRAVTITDLADRSTLLVTTRKGIDLLRYSGGDNPSLQTVGRASVSPARANDIIINGQTLAALADLPNDTVLVSSTTGRLEWYRMSEARLTRWVPYRSVELSDRQGLPLAIFGMALVPRVHRLVVADVSGEVQCLDSRTGVRVGKPFKHVSDIFGMTAHEASSSVVAADSRGGWLSIDALGCRPASVREPPTPVGSVAPDPNGHVVSTPQVEAARTAISFSPDGEMVAVTGHDGTARLYVAKTGALVSIAPHQSMTRSAAVSADHRLMTVGTADGRVVVWRVDGGAERFRLAGVDAFAADISGAFALIIGDGVAWEIELGTGKVLRSVRDEAFVGLLQAVPSSRPGAYAVWRPESGDLVLIARRVDGTGQDMELRNVDIGKDHRGRVFAVAALDNGRWAVAEHGEGKSILVLDAEGEILRRWPLDAPPVAFAVTDRLIAAIDRDGRLKAWNTDGKVLLVLTFDAGATTLTAGENTVFASGRVQGNPTSFLCDASQSDIHSGTASEAEAPSVRGQVPASCRALLDPGSINLARIAPDGHTLALSLRLADDNRPDSGEFALLRWEEDWRIRHIGTRGRIDAFSFTRDSAWLAVGERRGLSLWSLEDLRPVAAFPTPSPVRRLTALRRGPGDLTILSLDGLKPGILRSWDSNVGEFLLRGCSRLPANRPMPRQAGVPELPARTDVCSGYETPNGSIGSKVLVPNRGKPVGAS